MNMVASVLHLDRRSVKALRITDAYSLHRLVYSLYPDIRDEEQKLASTPSGILYADQGGDYHGRKILMLSNREPRTTVDGLHGDVVSKPIPDNFLDHEHYQFKVIVNPTRRDSSSRKLVAVRGREDVAQWFIERAMASWGFEVPARQLQVNNIEVLRFKDKNQRKVTIGQAYVQGVMRVTNESRFTDSFTRGIGRGRAYGCGLLQIVPVIENPFN